MFGFCHIDDDCAFIWVGKRLFTFNFVTGKVTDERDFDGDIIDVKLEKHLTGLLVNRQLLIVSNGQFDTAKTVELVRRPSSLKLIDGICYVADRSGDVYQIDPILEGENNDNKKDEEERKPILGHCSNLLQIEVDAKFIYTADQDEKVRISKRSHPFVIEAYLLGHGEFISAFAKSNVHDSTYYTTSGDGTCISWRDGESVAQTSVTSDEYVAHSLSLSADDVVTLSLQQYQHPLDGSELTKQEKQQIIFYKGLDLTQLARFELSETDYPLASFWRGTRCYWLIENERKQVGLYVYTMNNQSLIEHGQKTATLNVESPRDPEQWDKLRKVQPKTEFYDEYLRKRNEGFKQTRIDQRGKKRKRENAAQESAKSDSTVA